MVQIKVFDKETNRIVLMAIEPNNCLSREYLNVYFPGATRLYRHDVDPNTTIS
jgi:hypothetical protein